MPSESGREVAMSENELKEVLEVSAESSPHMLTWDGVALNISDYGKSIGLKLENIQCIDVEIEAGCMVKMLVCMYTQCQSENELLETLPELIRPAVTFMASSPCNLWMLEFPVSSLSIKALPPFVACKGIHG